MSAAPSAPDARTFFHEELPARFAALRERARAAGPAGAVDEAMAGVRACARWVVTGEGGGTFVVALEGGELRVADEPAGALAPVVQLEQTAVDLARMAEVLGRGHVERLASQPGLAERIPALLGRAVAGLAGLEHLRGAVALEVTGEMGFALVARFGPAAAPGAADATVRVDPQTLAALAAGELDPQQAFLAGGVRLEGDVGLALQLALAWMGPA